MISPSTGGVKYRWSIKKSEFSVDVVIIIVLFVIVIIYTSYFHPK